MRALAAFFRSPVKTQAMVLEAALLLLLARLLVAHVRMRHWRRRLDTVGASVPTREADQARRVHLEVARVVRAVSRHVPFRAVCLPQAMAAQWMLRRRSIPSQLVVGVRRAATASGFEYHAWLSAAGECLIGAGAIDTYTTLPPFNGASHVAKKAGESAPR